MQQEFENPMLLEGGARKERSLKELLFLVKAYAWELWKNKWLIALFCIPFLIWQGYQYLKTSTTYPAKLTFMVNEDEGGRFSGLSGILGSFGLGGATENNYERILELAKSKRIIHNVLLSKVAVEGKTDYLANHIIRYQKIQEEKWSKKNREGNAPMKDFFFTKDSIDKFNKMELSALKQMFGVVLGGEDEVGIFSTTLNDETGIMRLNAETRNESLTIVFLETMFDCLSKFYVEKAIEKNKYTYSIIQHKADSIRALLNNTEYRAASFEDQNKSLALSVDKVPQARYTRDKQLLMLMYGEAIKNLEVADFALKSSTPYVQSIDIPLPPLTENPPSKVRAALIGIGIGIALGSTFVLGRKIVMDAQAEA